MTMQDVQKALIAMIKEMEPSATIYTEKIPQGFIRPCYFMKVDQNDKALMNERFERTFTIQISYYPKNQEQPREEAKRKMEMLSLCLEWIDINGRPRRMMQVKQSIKEDHTLLFETGYKCYLTRTMTHDKMEHLKQIIQTDQE